MSYNEFLVNRTAAGVFNFPANAVGISASTITTNTGVKIPAGAIVTGIRYVGAAITGAVSAANLTIQALVGTQVLGTNNLVATAALVNTVANVQALSATQGVRVAAGGDLIIAFGTTGANRSDVSTGPCQVYVDYLYAA